MDNPKDEKHYVPIALEIFDLHYLLHHPSPFMVCGQSYCRQARPTVITEAFRMVEESRKQ